MTTRFLFSIYGSEKRFQLPHRVNSDMQLTPTSLLRPWIEPHGKDANCIGGSDVGRIANSSYVARSVGRVATPNEESGFFESC